LKECSLCSSAINVHNAAEDLGQLVFEETWFLMFNTPRTGNTSGHASKKLIKKNNLNEVSTPTKSEIRWCERFRE
jgi:hypothetical protein